MLPRIPNVSGWLKKWQLRLHLECPLWYSEKLVNGTKWHLQQGALNILLSPLSASIMPPRVSCPTVTMDLHRIPVSLPGQTSCCVWHSSFMMGCSLIAAGECLASLLSHWLIHGEGPPTEGPHLLSVLGAPLLTYNGCDTHKKNNLQGCFPPPSPLLFSFC